MSARKKPQKKARKISSKKPVKKMTPVMVPVEKMDPGEFEVLTAFANSSRAKAPGERMVPVMVPYATVPAKYHRQLTKLRNLWHNRLRKITAEEKIAEIKNILESHVAALIENEEGFAALQELSSDPRLISANGINQLGIFRDTITKINRIIS